MPSEVGCSSRSSTLTVDAVGFGGRVMPGGEGPKYKNSAESTIYAKSKVLYGLNWAKGDIVAADEAIVCEGYTDVIGFAKAGVPRAVATCGTALTEEHVRLLRALRPPGGAGLRRRCGRPARGRAVLPVGEDATTSMWRSPPCRRESIRPTWPREDPARLRTAVDGAVPFLSFRVDRVLDRADLRHARRSGARGRGRARSDRRAPQ